jgi:hypothetical protein
VAVQVSVQVDHAQLVTAGLARQVPVAHVRVAHLVQVSVAVPRVLVSVAVPVQALLVQVASAHLVLAVAQVVAAAVTVVELLVRSVRAEAREPRRLVSRSARNAKSSNREWRRALVARSFHVEMVPLLFDFAEVLAFRTSQTRSKPLQLS